MKCMWQGCDKESEDLKEHIEVHAERTSGFSCKWEGCSKHEEKLSKYSFGPHVRTHAEIRPYKCMKCEKSFSKLDALNKHGKRHEAGDKAIQTLLNKCYYLDEIRECEEIKTFELLRDRQTQVNCQRILHFILETENETDSWNNF